MLYRIKNYTKEQAKILGVQVVPSSSVGKKIDVFRNGIKIVSIGDLRYSDYPSYILSNGIEYANVRRRLYKLRHKKDMEIVGSAGYYAGKLLW
jgi:hypothetical protein